MKIMKLLPFVGIAAAAITLVALDRRRRRRLNATEVNAVSEREPVLEVFEADIIVGEVDVPDPMFP